MKTVYTQKNLIILQNGASFKLHTLYNINNLQVVTDNYDKYYIFNLFGQTKRSLILIKKTKIYDFFNKFKLSKNF